METKERTCGAGPLERAHDAGGDGPAVERRGRMSAKRKQSAVLRLFRGEALDLVSPPICLAQPSRTSAQWASTSPPSVLNRKSGCTSRPRLCALASRAAPCFRWIQQVFMFKRFAGT